MPTTRLTCFLLLAACGADDAPPAETAWVDGPALPGGRLEPGVVGTGDAIWVIGGFDDGLEVTTETWILDDGADAWRPGPDAPAALTHTPLAAIDGTIYLLGGLVGTEFTPSADAWAIDPGADAWRALAPLPEARGAAAVIVDGARVILAGGSTTDASLATVLAYDVDADAWTSLPDLPSPRSHAIGARAPDGALLAIGGTATLDATQPIADAWTTLDPLPRGRAGTAGATMAGRLWIPGGAHALRYEPTADVSSLPVD